MNLGIPLLIGALAAPVFAAPPQPVRIQLNSYSILFHPAIYKDRFIDVDYLNQVTSEGDNPPNGELSPSRTSISPSSSTSREPTSATFWRARFP
jgi:hypothetical protein